MLKTVGNRCDNGESADSLANRLAYDLGRRGASQDGLVCVIISDALLTRDTEEVVRGGTSAKTAVLPRTTRRVEERAFLGTGVESLIVSASLGEIGRSAFWDCPQLRRVALSEGLEAVGEGWFWDSRVERVVVPASVREIRVRAFRDCKRLRSVEFWRDSRLQVIGEEAFCGSGLESFTSPPSLRAVARGAFKGCRQLRSARLGEGLEKVEDSCFCGSGLTRVEIPRGVGVIGDDAFRWCT